jgi:hypothetical protein
MVLVRKAAVHAEAFAGGAQDGQQQDGEGVEQQEC